MRLVSRSGWGARSRSIPTNITPTGGVTIHYVGGPVHISTHSACDDRVRSIQNHHIDGNGWADIAYSALVCPHGYVFVGRGPNRRTAANGTNDGNQRFYAVCALIGGSQQPTDAMVQGIKDAVAWLRAKGGAGRGVNGHRDHLSTSCPGAPLYRMVRDGVFGSGGSSGGGSGSGSGPYESYRKGVAAGSRTLRLYAAGDDVKVVQKAAGTKADGYYGPDTVKAVRAYQADRGLAVDGITGPQTWGAVLGKKPSSPSKRPSPGLVVDGQLGPKTAKATQKALGVTEDGRWGPVTVKALQRRVGAGVDGLLGPKTTRKVQAHVGASVDGIWPSIGHVSSHGLVTFNVGAVSTTTKALQRALNDGDF